MPVANGRRAAGLVVAALLMVSCEKPHVSSGAVVVAAVPSKEPMATCDPAVRVERDVSIMFRNEWMSGQLALAACRGSVAQKGDLSELMKWLKDEARVGRMRTCGGTAVDAVPAEDLRAAETRAPGVRDWCFAVLANI